MSTEKKRTYTSGAATRWRERTDREYRIGDIVLDPRNVTETSDEWRVTEEVIQMMNEEGRLRIFYGGDSNQFLN